MLSTCGRGGNAQAVRDEILNIMHRNNIGEKRGTWMEVGHFGTITPDIGCQRAIVGLKAVPSLCL